MKVDFDFIKVLEDTIENLDAQIKKLAAKKEAHQETLDYVLHEQLVFQKEVPDPAPVETVEVENVSK